MFCGYNEKTLEFMWGIRLNNDREWFMAHKEEYKEHLYQPTVELGQEVHRRFLERFPKSQLNLHVSRIYRDARRLHGNGPYKDHLWFTLRREEGVWTEQPVFWFEVAPEESTYGVGFWNTSAQTMAAMRRDMDNDPQRLEKLVRRLGKRPEFTLQGDEYARKKEGPSKLLAPWYNRKSISIGAGLAFEQVCTPGLVDVLSEGYEFLEPYYKYLDFFCRNGLEDLK